MNLPKLRFKEFTDEWDEKKLEDIVNFSKGNNLSKEDLIDSGIYPCILYGQLYTRYYEVIKTVFSKTNKNDKNIPKSKKGDILIPSSGEAPLDISTSSCILLDGVLLGGDINILSPINSDGRFLSYLINNNKRIEVAKVAQGNSIVHLYNDNLKKINLNIPTIEEQEKIANTLELLDKKIELQSKKIEALKLFKLSTISTLFSNLNYNSTLGEVCESKSSNLSMEKIQNNKGIYKVYGANGFIKNINYFLFNEKYISIIKDGANVGKTHICEKNSSTLSTLNAIFPKGINIYYLNCILENINFRKYIVGSGIPHIYFNDYKNEKVKLHENYKQNIIGNASMYFDKKISLEQKNLIKLNILKKGLLQSMFT